MGWIITLMCAVASIAGLNVEAQDPCLDYARDLLENANNEKY